MKEFQTRLDEARKKRLEERRKERILERKVQRRIEREERERKEKEERERRGRKRKASLGQARDDEIRELSSLGVKPRPIFGGRGGLGILTQGSNATLTKWQDMLR